MTNNKYDGEVWALHSRFQLESTTGDTFSVSHLTGDCLSVDVNRGKSARGGIAFAIYPDSVPKVLRFKTGLSDGQGAALEPVSPDLRNLIPQEK